MRLIRGLIAANAALRILLLTLALLGPAAGVADEVPVPAAMDAAVNWMSLVRGAGAPKPTVKEVTTLDQEGAPALYVVNLDPEGWVLLPAEDAALPIIGYNPTGAISLQEMPPALESLLAWRRAEVKDIRTRRLPASERTARHWRTLREGDLVRMAKDFPDPAPRLARPSGAADAVLPLDAYSPLEALWNQGQYYNTLCPADAGGPAGHVVTGCVATAMGELMYWWGYPTIGQGSFTYTPSGYPAQTVDFSASSYAWASMPSSVTGTNAAVEQLLWHCGVAVDMGYGASSSGAYVQRVAPALIHYFKYSRAAIFLFRSQFPTTADWLTQLKVEFDAVPIRPVIYGGFDSSRGGHSWMLEGYQNDSFYCNWGWSGTANGFYSLDNLNPQGTLFNFANSQNAITRILPSSFMPSPSVEALPNLPATLTLGDTLDIQASSYSSGPTPDAAYLSISFPDLTGPDDDSRITLVNKPSGAHFNVSDAGATITDRFGCQITATSLLCELSAPTMWSATPAVEFQVRPKAAGTFRIWVRSALGLKGAYVGAPYDSTYHPNSWWPNPSETTATTYQLDQQSWEVVTYQVNVVNCCSLSTGTSPGGGSITVNTASNCTGGYAGGTAISLTANARSGYTFTGWSGTGGSFSSTTAATTTFTISGTA
jgi:hypothetical protein